MKATAYIRVSNTEQVDGHSLEAQERAIGEYCRTRGWELVTVYREEGKSAHTDSIHKRPLLKRANRRGGGPHDGPVVPEHAGSHGFHEHLGPGRSRS
jgi:hypothetical protein